MTSPSTHHTTPDTHHTPDIGGTPDATNVASVDFIDEKRATSRGGVPANGRERGLRMYGSDFFAGLVEQSMSAFEEKFGRPMQPDDPLFWDEAADEPTPLSEQQIAEAFNEAAKAAGIPAPARFAAARCGFLLTDANLELVAPEDAEWWVSEYHLYGVLSDEADRRGLVSQLTDEITAGIAQAADTPSPHEAIGQLSDWIWEIPQAVALRVVSAVNNVNFDLDPWRERRYKRALRRLVHTEPGLYALAAAHKAAEQEQDGEVTVVEVGLDEMRWLGLFGLASLVAYKKTHPHGDTPGRLAERVHEELDEALQISWQLPFDI